MKTHSGFPVFARWRCLLLCGALLLSLLPGATGAATEERAPRTFTLTPGATLDLALPKTWKHQLQQPPTGRPILLLTPGSGAAFQILITPVWADRPELTLPGTEEIRRNVTQALEQARPQAVETTLTLKEVMSSYARGYYFTATDKQPKEGEYKYMTQGMLRVGDAIPCVLMFTILTQDGGDAVIAGALDLLRKARLNLPAKTVPAPLAPPAARKTVNDQ